MLERDIEKYLVSRIKTIGGTAEKFRSPNKRAVPDRVVTLPGGQIIFVELKAPGEGPTKTQARDHKRRRAMGCTVLVIDTKQGVDDAFPL